MTCEFIRLKMDVLNLPYQHALCAKPRPPPFSEWSRSLEECRAEPVDTTDPEIGQAKSLEALVSATHQLLRTEKDRCRTLPLSAPPRKRNAPLPRSDKLTAVMTTVSTKLNKTHSRLTILSQLYPLVDSQTVGI